MNKRILVVDTSVSVRDILGQQLRQAGYHVAVAESGQQAADILGTESFDIIVSAAQVSPGNLYDLMRVVADLAYEPALVLVSGADEHALDTARALALAYSINLLGVLRRPVEGHALLALLDGVANVQGARGEGGNAVLAEAEFVRGLMADGLAPIFQPKVRLRDGTLAGVEVFARWKSPQGGMLGAGAILRLARERGYMDILTYRMLELAAEVQARWVAEGRQIEMAVNVTIDNLRKDDFAETVVGVIEQWSLPPHLMRLELSEADLDIDADGPIEVLKYLSGRGVRLGLDDFAAGYAPLIALKDIPFDEMIVDRRFARRAAADKRARIVLEEAISLAHRLDMSCTCEGIESTDQLAIVAAIGADTVQGYHVAKPMDGDHLTRWADDWEAGRVDIGGMPPRDWLR
ncbi:EAL domain-containing response regulator [Eilatimonas milleporae]|uniref:EAL domain-containing protein (Putative c-di-GMP-specific phosphodiesterase class I) n=1 Tax=Eilatimonas milleporae TaxID=911205 RepID=A0A3M0CCA2_9PROT|nr:EAL domain-containing response regulator [Eilatimonas milleporae]RMB04639.1 EAL domain-containing protein (putative c-di-GMP-specific phosphodiesterase class I) [Eilatimonas milleporae]